MTDIGIFICPVCEAVIEGDRPCPNRNLRPHGEIALVDECPYGEHVHSDGTRWPTGRSCGGDRPLVAPPDTTTTEGS